MSSQVVALTPFTVRRIALWRDCDPAGVVYAGNFSDYLLDATALLRRHVFGLGWRAIRETTGVDTPAKALSLVFQGSLWPDDLLDIEVYVGEIRVGTIDFLACAHRVDDGTDLFIGRLTSICVAVADRHMAQPIPEMLRRAALRYRDSHPPPKSLLEARW